MRALLILLLIYVNYCLSDNETKYSLKIYPKKVKPGNLQVINAGKYKKPPQKYARKQLGEETDYTVFPLERRDNREQIYVGPKPLFTPENIDSRTRVKKMLPDYIWSLRRKRSAVPDSPDPQEKAVAPETTKLEIPAANTNATKAVDTTNDKAKDKPKTQASVAPNKARKNNPKPKSKTPVRSAGKKKAKPASKPRGGKVTKVTKAKTSVKRNSNKQAVRGKKGAKPKSKSKPKPKPKPKTNKPSRAGNKAKGKKQNNRKASRRLIAARDALIEDYPYVVSIQKDDQHWCGGALLNPRLVITTANCMWKSSRISRMEIRAGSRNVDQGGQVAGISEVMKHPGWGIRKDPDHDIALVLLDRNLRFSDSIHGVDLPNRAMMPPFDDVWITSWGADRRDGVYEPMPTTLQVYHARLMDRGKCNNVTERFGVSVTENFICLAQTGKRAPCTRDTGAPAVSDGVLWGLASWGIRKLCGTERFPAMFSYVASQTNMDFILNATHYLMADERHYPYLDRFPNIRARPSTPLTTTMASF